VVLAWARVVLAWARVVLARSSWRVRVSW